MKLLLKPILIVACVIILFILTLEVPLSIDKIFHLHSNDLTIDSNFFTQKIPLDYLKVLTRGQVCCSDTTNEKLHFIKTIEFKHRSPISYFTYDGKYHFQICKISSSYDLPLTKNLIAINASTTTPQNAYYTLYKENTFDYRYKASISQPRLIHLNMFGNSIGKIIRNDSIACYYARARNFSITYNKDELPQIFGNTIEDTFSKNYQPIEILFFEHLSNLYLLIMSKDDQDYKKGTLLSLIQNH